METKYHIVKRRMKTVKLSNAQEKQFFGTVTKKPTAFSLIISFLKSFLHKKQHQRNIYAEHLERNN